MNKNNTELSVNTEVLGKIAAIATKEVDGVVSLSKKAVDLKGAVKSGNPLTGVKVESVNGALKINVYICVKEGALVREVAEKVQASVKDRIQTMTGTAVTQVNVNVADVEFESEDAE